MAVTTDKSSTPAPIRPFEIGFADSELIDLRRRIAATRWPSKELVADRSQASSSRLYRPSVATGSTSTSSGASRSG